MSRIVAVEGKPEGDLFQTDVPTAGMLIAPSKMGKFLYLEMTEEHDSIRKVGAASPEDIAFILHVCDEKGEDLQLVSLRNQCDKSYTHGRFYGENIVGLYEKGRNSGKIQETFVFLDTGFTQYWGRNEKNENLGVSLSPDKNRMLCYVSKGDEKLSLVYINGQQVYPIFDESRPEELAAEDYAKGNGKTARWIKDNPGDYFLGHGLTQLAEENLWSKDSRYAVFMKRPYRHPLSLPEKGKTGLEYVVIDVEQAGPGNTRDKYIKTLPTNISSEELFNRLAYATWSEDGKSLIIKDERNGGQMKEKHEQRVFENGN